MQALREITTYLNARGYQPMGPAQLDRTLTRAAMRTFGFQIQGQRCYTAVVIGAPNARFGLQLLSRERVVSSGDGSRPFAEVCTAPGSRGQLRTRIQHISGPVEYYLAVFQTTRQTVSQLASLLSARDTVEATLEPDPATAQRIAALQARLNSEGYTVASEPRGLRMSRRESREFGLNLREGVCYAFATFGGPQTRDTDLYIYAPNGRLLASDRTTALDANVDDFCPNATGRYRLSARLFEGVANSPVFVASYQRSESGQAAQPGETGESASNVVESQSTVGMGLDENYEQRHASIQRRGYEPLGDPRSHELETEAHRDFSISLEGGRCYAVLAVGDNGVRNLDLLLLDGSGRELDRDYDSTTEAMVRVCPSADSELTVRVQMSEGAGRFIYATYRWGSGIRGAWGLEGIMYVRHAELTRILDADGYESDLDNSPERGALATTGRRRSHNVELEADQCYTVIAVGDASIQDLNVEIARGRESLEADDSVSAFPSVRLCSDRGGRHRITVTAEQGRGAYFLQLYRRRPSETPSP